MRTFCKSFFKALQNSGSYFTSKIKKIDPGVDAVNEGFIKFRERKLLKNQKSENEEYHLQAKLLASLYYYTNTIKMKHLYLLLGLVTVLSCSTQREIKCPVDGYILDWSDEFDGTILDTTKWAYRVDNKHRSIQLKKNVHVKDGSLVLELIQLKEPVEGKFASGAGIVTKRRFRYGYYEVKAKLGSGKDTDGDGFKDDGWHHAFWAMAALVESSEVNTTYPDIRRTEIDCFENASDHEHEAESGLDRFTQHVIVWKENGKEWGRLPEPPGDITEIPGFDANKWHTYGFKWDEKEILFYVDGEIQQIAIYPADKFEHDMVNVWLTAISANWCKAGAQDSRAEYDYFRYFKPKE